MLAQLEQPVRLQSIAGEGFVFQYKAGVWTAFRMSAHTLMTCRQTGGCSWCMLGRTAAGMLQHRMQP